MVFAMTLLSISLLWHATAPRNLTQDDLNPVRIWQRVDEQLIAFGNAPKSFTRMRFVHAVSAVEGLGTERAGVAEPHTNSGAGHERTAAGERPVPESPAGNQGTRAPENM